MCGHGARRIHIGAGQEDKHAACHIAARTAQPTP
jgi:hypothetical protein